MPINANDIIRITYFSTAFNQRILFHMDYRVGNPPTGSGTTQQQLDVLCDLFAATGTGTYLDAYRGMLGDNVTVNTVRAQVIYPIRSAFEEDVISLAGLSPEGPCTTPNVCAVATFRTALAGRKQISNKHIGPIAAAGYDLGRLTSQLQTDLGDFVEKWKLPAVDANNGGYNPGIYHRAGDGPAQKFDPITAGTGQTTVRVMRRRTVGVGI